MSMNLAFYVQGGGGYVDFPFQTPTEMSYEVLAEKTLEGRLKIVRRELKAWGVDEDLIEEYLEQIDQYLKNPNLTLTVV